MDDPNRGCCGGDARNLCNTTKDWFLVDSKPLRLCLDEFILASGGGKEEYGKTVKW